MPAPVLAQRGEVVPIPGRERHAAGRATHALPRDEREGDLAHPSEALLVVLGESLFTSLFSLVLFVLHNVCFSCLSRSAWLVRTERSCILWLPRS